MKDTSLKLLNWVDKSVEAEFDASKEKRHCDAITYAFQARGKCFLLLMLFPFITVLGVIVLAFILPLSPFIILCGLCCLDIKYVCSVFMVMILFPFWFIVLVVSFLIFAIVGLFSPEFVHLIKLKKIFELWEKFTSIPEKYQPDD